MDAIALLKADHKTLETLFHKFERAGRNAKKLKGKLVEQMIRELAIHAAIEERIFYPAVRAQATKLEDSVLEALEEHHVVKWLLSELQELTPDAERFDAKVKVLIENVRNHVEEEEQDLFPQVRKAFTAAELKDMGQRLQMAKETAPTRAHPRAPDAPPGNLVTGAMSAVIDMGKDAVKAARRKVRGLATQSSPQRRRGRDTKPAELTDIQKQGNDRMPPTEAETHYLM